MSKVTYKDAGVDLDRYGEAMARLPALAHRTYTPRVINSDGGFAGLFRLDFDNALFARKYDNPVLVSGTDGVGTKIKVAIQTGRHDTIGIDLVAMSVNDTICCGAEPLFFLDYLALPQDDPALIEQIVQGVSQGCMQADCALLGGETAVMPDLYAPGDYDLAGFCVGVVERKHLIDGHAIGPDDLVIGIASSGLHSNGYSLIRKVVFEIAGLSVDDYVERLEQTVGEALLTPTRIYVHPVRQVLNYYKVKSTVHGIAHITGGGLRENLQRIVPKGVQLEIQPDSWPVPEVFRWIEELGEIDQQEMDRVFNMGIGLVLVVSPFYANNIQQILTDAGMESWVIGSIVEDPGGVE